MIPRARPGAGSVQAASAALAAALALFAASAAPVSADDGDGSPVVVTLEAAGASTSELGAPFRFRVVADNPGASAEELTIALGLRQLDGGAEVWFAEEPHSAEPGQSKLAGDVSPAQWFVDEGEFEVFLRASDGDTDTLAFTVTGPTLTVPTFDDVTGALGLATSHQSGSTCNGTHSAGAAWGDIEGDGDLDLYLPDQRQPAKLFVNQGGGFVERAAKAGVTNGTREGHGAVFADYDNDGDQDLFVVNLGGDRLYRNDGSGKFTDVAGAAGVADPRPGSSASWGDFDDDGNLDLYVARWGNCIEDDYLDDSLYRSNGDGTFSDETAALSATGPTAGRGFLGGFFDSDGDNDLDLLLANDFAIGPSPEPNVLWRNDGFGDGEPGFVNVSGPSGAGVAMNSMGIAIGDYDRDLDLDFAISNIGANALFQNDGAGAFDDVAAAAGVDRPLQQLLDETPLTPVTAITWGLEFKDVNNDGWEDLYIAAGAMVGPDNQPNELYVNDRAGGFLDLSAPSGLADPGQSRGLAFADYDRDGRLDVYVVNRVGEPRLYRNITPGAGHWLAVRTVGTVSNRDGCGAKLLLTSASGQQLRQVFCGSTSLASGSDPTVHFGLGADEVVESLVVRWPSGRVQTLEQIGADELITLTEPGKRKPAPGLDLALEGKRRQSAGRAVRVVVGCGTACDGKVRARVSARRGSSAGPARSWRLRGARISLDSAAAERLALRPSRSLARKLRRQARSGRRLTAAVRVTASNALGESDTVRRRIRLR